MVKKKTKDLLQIGPLKYSTKDPDGKNRQPGWWYHKRNGEHLSLNKEAEDWLHPLSAKRIELGLKLLKRLSE